MMQKISSLNELIYNIAEFFGAAQGKQTDTFIEKSLQAHKKTDGKNVVLLVSNGVCENTSSNQEIFKDFHILETGEMVDKSVLALGGDRSVQIYKDTVSCINNNKILRQESLAPSAQILQASKTKSDQEILKEVAEHIQKSFQPTFTVACLNSTFLTKTGDFTENVSKISQLIEATNSTGTLYFLTSRHQTEPGIQKKSAAQTLKPIVPFLIVGELLRHSKEKSKSVESDSKSEEIISKEHKKSTIYERLQHAQQHLRRSR